MKIISRIIVLLVSLSCFATAVAQEYKYEIGAMAGSSMYMGDANQNAFMQGWGPSAGIIFRNNINFRWALKADLLWGKVSGDTKNTDNVFPGDGQASFERNFYELGAQMEFNFFPYSDKYPYLNTKKLSPYAFMGLGVTMAPGSDQTFFGLNLPIGVGIKYKLRNKINIGVEYTVHKLFGDGFDSPVKDGFNLNDPYRTKGGLFKNKDWYNTLYFTITFEFGVKDNRCL